MRITPIETESIVIEGVTVVFINSAHGRGRMIVECYGKSHLSGVSCCCALPDLDLRLAVGTSPSWSNVLINPETADSRVDIAGATFSFLVKESPSDEDADAVFTLTSAGGEIVITDAADGEYQIDSTVAKSELLEAGRWYYWYLRVTLSSGEIRLARKGKLYAEPN